MRGPDHYDELTQAHQKLAEDQERRTAEERRATEERQVGLERQAAEAAIAHEVEAQKTAREKTDRETLEAFGHDADDPGTRAKWRELQAKVDTQKIDKREMHDQMRRFEQYQHPRNPEDRTHNETMQQEPNQPAAQQTLTGWRARMSPNRADLVSQQDFAIERVGAARQQEETTTEEPNWKRRQRNPLEHREAGAQDHEHQQAREEQQQSSEREQGPSERQEAGWKRRLNDPQARRETQQQWREEAERTTHRGRGGPEF